nr:hypothetical protein ACMD2_22227 [Ipomoea batatas]
MSTASSSDICSQRPSDAKIKNKSSGLNWRVSKEGSADITARLKGTGHPYCRKRGSLFISGCSASTSFLTSSTPTLWSVDIRSATTELLTPPSVVTLRPSTALESPRFATNSTPFDIAAVRQHDPTEAICGCANHDLLTIRKNSSSIASTRVEGSTLDVTEKVVGNETRSFRAAMAVVNADIGGGGGGLLGNVGFGVVGVAYVNAAATDKVVTIVVVVVSVSSSEAVGSDFGHCDEADAEEAPEGGIAGGVVIIGVWNLRESKLGGRAGLGVLELIPDFTVRDKRKHFVRQRRAFKQRNAGKVLPVAEANERRKITIQSSGTDGGNPGCEVRHTVLIRTGVPGRAGDQNSLLHGGESSRGNAVSVILRGSSAEGQRKDIDVVFNGLIHGRQNVGAETPAHPAHFIDRQSSARGHPTGRSGRVTQKVSTGDDRASSGGRRVGPMAIIVSRRFGLFRLVDWAQSGFVTRGEISRAD